MRVLLVGSYGPSLLNFRGPLIADMLAQGHEVHVAAPDLKGELRTKLIKFGAIVHDTPLDRQGAGVIPDLDYLRRLTKLFREVAPGLVITYTIKPNIWGAVAGSHTGTRCVALVTGLGIVFTDTGKVDDLKSRVMKFMVRRLYRHAAKRNWRLVFQNPDDIADFEAAGCLINRSKVRMINGSGIDLEHFVAAPLPEEPNFLMIARILGAKGVREYGRAAVEVKKTHPSARFRLVGYFDQGPDAISEFELNEWMDGGLEYLGPSGDVRPHLSASRIYVLPSYREGTPRSVLEAMATGRPIITSDAPGCREPVDHGVNGYLVPVRNPETLAARMRDMIDDPAGTAVMAQESLRIAREKYDVRKVNRQLMGHLGLLDEET